MSAREIVALCVLWQLFRLSSCSIAYTKYLKLKAINWGLPLAGHKLNATPIATSRVTNHIKCMAQCGKSEGCVAINLSPLQGGHRECEMLNTTRYSLPMANFTAQAGWTYVGPKTKCDASPCPKELLCIQQEREADYACVLLSKGKDCADLYKRGFTTDGVYPIDPDGRGAFKVRCDMKTSGGGWTIFQRRIDGSVDFFRYWKDYKNGFGDPESEYWLGLDKINRLTNSGMKVIRIDMGDTTGITKYAEYSFFAVASEIAKYKLSLGTYSGTAGDALGFHGGMAFTTRDVDNDTADDRNCAARYKGAWWYNGCHFANLNGYYYLGSHTSLADGVNWKQWKGFYYSLRKTEMKIRPCGF